MKSVVSIFYTVSAAMPHTALSKSKTLIPQEWIFHISFDFIIQTHCQSIWTFLIYPHPLLPLCGKLLFLKAKVRSQKVDFDTFTIFRLRSLYFHSCYLMDATTLKSSCHFTHTGWMRLRQENLTLNREIENDDDDCWL